MSDLSARFVGLGPNDKAMFLARVAHMATIAARESYATSVDHPERDYDHPDAIILRDANNFIHRVVGYIMHVLDGTEMAGQDESVMIMIEDHYRERNLGDLLTEWLATSD
ncbi:hypothetical protein LJR220_001200 [Bradyrhizobium sp. LjRoot220]|uniref:hypothetical protein n=1 Tax=Bradyrhizobium sp. LjRoot220 TaxID=3342284 RepID=UPI003ECD26B3